MKGELDKTHERYKVLDFWGQVVVFTRSFDAAVTRMRYVPDSTLVVVRWYPDPEWKKKNAWPKGHALEHLNDR